MQNLVIGEGSLITIKNVSLPKAQFVKFRPQSVDFLDISNPRAVLENSLRKFTCVTVGDQIMIPYLDKTFYLEIREVKPADAVSIIETDCNVDFEEPVGYKESEYAKHEQKQAKEDKNYVAPVRELQKAKAVTAEEAIAAEKAFKPFAGGAQRIDGKQAATSTAKAEKDTKVAPPVSTPVVTTTEPSFLAQPRVSRIGDKFSKNKVSVSAFTGPANKLSKK